MTEQSHRCTGNQKDILLFFLLLLKKIIAFKGITFLSSDLGIRLWKAEFSRTIEFHSVDREWPQKQTNDSCSGGRGSRVIYITLRTQER